jgi:hypothetical protein
MKSPIKLKGQSVQKCDLLCNILFNLRKGTVRHVYDKDGKVRFGYTSRETEENDYQLIFKNTPYNLLYININEVVNKPFEYDDEIEKKRNEIQGECIMIFKSQYNSEIFLELSVFLKPTDLTGKSQKCFTEFLSVVSRDVESISTTIPVETRSDWTLSDILPDKKAFYWYMGSDVFTKNKDLIKEGITLTALILEKSIYIDKREFDRIIRKQHETHTIVEDETRIIFYNDGMNIKGERKDAKIQIKCERVEVRNDINLNKELNKPDENEDVIEGEEEREEITYEMRRCDNPNALSLFEARFGVFVTAFIGLLIILFFFKGSEITDETFMKIPLKSIGELLWVPIHFSYVYFSKVIIAVMYIFMFCMHVIYQKIFGIKGESVKKKSGYDTKDETFVSIKESLYNEKYKSTYKIGIILAIIGLLIYFFKVFGSPFINTKRKGRPGKNKITRNIVNMIGGNYKIDDFERESDLSKIIPREEERELFIKTYYLNLETKNNTSKTSLKVAINELKRNLLKESESFESDIKRMVNLNIKDDPFSNFDFPNVTEGDGHLGTLHYKFCGLWNTMYSSDCLNIPKRNCSENNKIIKPSPEVGDPPIGDPHLILSFESDGRVKCRSYEDEEGTWGENTINVMLKDYIKRSKTHNNLANGKGEWLRSKEMCETGLKVKLRNEINQMTGYIYRKDEDDENDENILKYFQREFDREDFRFYFEGNVWLEILEGEDVEERSSVIGEILRLGDKNDGVPPVDKSRKLYIRRFTDYKEDDVPNSNLASGEVGNFEGNQYFTEMYLKNGITQISTISEMVQRGSERLRPPLIELVVKMSEGEQTTIVKGRIFKTEESNESTVWFKFEDEYVGYNEDFNGQFCDIGSITRIPYQIEYAPFIALETSKWNTRRKKKRYRMGQKMGYFKTDPTYLGSQTGPDFMKHVETDCMIWNMNGTSDNPPNPILKQYYDYLPSKKLLDYNNRQNGPLVTLTTVALKGEKREEKKGHLWMRTTVYVYKVRRKKKKRKKKRKKNKKKKKYFFHVYFTLIDNPISYTAYFPKNKIVDIKVEAPLNYFKVKTESTELKIQNYLREPYKQNGFEISVKKKGSIEFTSKSRDWGNKNVTEVDAYLVQTDNKQYKLNSEGKLEGPLIILKTNLERNMFSHVKGKIIKHRNSIYSEYTMYFVPIQRMSQDTGSSEKDVSIQFIIKKSRKKKNSVVERKIKQSFWNKMRAWFERHKGWFIALIVIIFIIICIVVGYRIYKNRNGEIKIGSPEEYNSLIKKHSGNLDKLDYNIPAPSAPAKPMSNMSNMFSMIAPDVPNGPAVVPNGPAVVPNAPAVVPNGPAVVPNGPAVVPNAPAVVPNGPAVVPNAPAVVPNVTNGLTPSGIRNQLATAAMNRIPIPAET